MEKEADEYLMYSKKAIDMLKVFSVCLGFLLSAVVHAATNPIVVNVYDRDSQDYLRVKIHSQVVADSLFGEPLITCRAKWQMLSANIDGNTYSPNNFPAELVSQVRLFSLRMIFQIDQRSGFNAIACDPGHLGATGDTRWSYTVAGSPDWSRLIRDDIQNTYNAPLQSQFALNAAPESPGYLSGDDAKDLYQRVVLDGKHLTGSWVRAVALEKASLNLWPLRRHLQELQLVAEEKQLNKRRETAKPVAPEAIDQLFSDAAFDAQLRNAKSVSLQTEAIATSKDALAAIQTQAAQAERRYRQQLQHLQDADACYQDGDRQADQLASLVQDMRGCLESWSNLRPFYDDRERYGFRQGDRVAIEAQYSSVTPFDRGSALVRKNGQLLSINPQGKVQRNLGDVRLESNDFSKAGLVLVSRDGLHGYMNARGELIIDFSYQEAESFDSFQRAIVYNPDAGKLLIDEQGRVILRGGVKRDEDKPGQYLTVESYTEEDMGCHPARVDVEIYYQRHDADGNSIGGLEREAYSRRKICLQG
ncbi:WG repeat-containing protein [Marinobacter sp. ANT_B65]|uniref:WG repeat-containing protein n=1 Tax=Marinobacter sp. ANT_B65 TaxID=2039467 RepID=UPI000BBEC711|nr:WG repeat-containing protein [Marinobacter sp. ANT_B65]PCM43024.1 hypothetical protein CPA50_18225 [Marinobacter sp. ANT_B65]